MNQKPLAVVIALCVVCNATIAQTAPKLLPFQGRLTDQNGVAVSNSVRLVQFKIYDVPTGGSPVWAGELHRTTVNGGLVNVMLGSKTPFTGVDFDKQLYLEITVDINADNSITLADPPMLPRQVILPAVFTKEAADSRKLNGYDWTPIFGVNNPTNPLPASKLADGSLPGFKIQPSSITSNQIASQTITAAQIADNTIIPSKIAPASLPLSVLAKEVLDQLVPAGTIIAFGGRTNKIADGWLLCDGRGVNSSVYSRLYSAISTNWGTGGGLGSTNNFNLPDLRGMFLRGVNGTRNDGWHDLESVGRSNAIPVNVAPEARIVGGNSGNEVGSVQLESTKKPMTAFGTSTNGSHSHTFRMRINGDDNTGNLPENGTDGLLGTATTSSDGNHTHLIVDGGDLETRPKNAYVHYLIKY